MLYLDFHFSLHFTKRNHPNQNPPSFRASSNNRSFRRGYSFAIYALLLIVLGSKIITSIPAASMNVRVGFVCVLKGFGFGSRYDVCCESHHLLKRAEAHVWRKGKGAAAG